MAPNNQWQGQPRPPKFSVPKTDKTIRSTDMATSASDEAIAHFEAVNPPQAPRPEPPKVKLA